MATNTKTQIKRGFWGRLVRSRWLWGFIAGVFVLTTIFSWLLSTYKPPFPPQWIGVKYYLYEIDEPIDLDKLSSLDHQLKTVQSALLSLEPTTDEARRLLGEEVLVQTYTLTDLDAISFLLKNELAASLSGIDPEDGKLAQQIIANPSEYLELTHVVLAITQINNFDPDQELFIEEITSQGEKIPHTEYEQFQDSIKLAPSLAPLDGEDQIKNSENVVTIDERNTYRIYENEESKTPIDSSILDNEYDSFVEINGTLVPTKAGRSPLLILSPGKYELQEGASAVPITYYHAVHTLNGLPFAKGVGVGHGWFSFSFEENGVFYPVMTVSLFNHIDTDNSLNTGSGNFTNIATYTNLGLNQKDDWEKSKKTLNRIPVTTNESRTRLNKITPEEAERLILKRGWYLPQYSSQEYYEKYLQESRAATNNLKDKALLSLAIVQVHFQNIMNTTFWGAIQAWMNGTLKDTRYNGIESNCVSYSTDLWNTLDRNPNYNPKMLGIVAVPGKLYKTMKSDEVISLPPAESVPEDMQKKPLPGDYGQ